MCESAVCYRAKWVVPSRQPPIENAFVEVKHGKIVTIGTGRPSGAFVDLGEVAILPGLVNAHTHLEFSDLSEPLGRSSMIFVEWIRTVIQQRREKETDDFDRSKADAIHKGLIELQESGTAAVGEIATAPLDLQVYDESNIQVMGFLERIISSDSAIDDSLQSKDMGNLASAPRWSNKSGNVEPAISPHAPYTVTRTALEKLVSFGIDNRMSVAMHLAESQDELELLKNNSGPFVDLLESVEADTRFSRFRFAEPLEYLRVLAKGKRSLVIHGNYLQAGEFEFIGQNRGNMHLVFCPRTHAYFGHEPYPIDRICQHNIPLALGTDSRASNPDLNIWRELQFVLKTYQQVNPSDAFRWITCNAANALGFGDCCGDISVGLNAQFNILPLINKSTENVFEYFQNETIEPIPIERYLMQFEK